MLALGSIALGASEGAVPPSGTMPAAHAAGADDGGAREEGKTPDPKRHAAALKVIKRHLEAVGGAEKLAGIQSLKLTGGMTFPGYPPTDTATFFFKAPGRYRQESATQVVVYSEEKKAFDNGSGETPLPPERVGSIDYLTTLGLNGFTLLAWEKHFDRAEYLGKKRYGEAEQYVVLLPEAQDGRDVTVHFDAETYLLHRVVFNVPDPKAQYVKKVSRFRDYQTLAGLQFPTSITSMYIGWRERDGQLVIQDVELNPAIDESIFREAKLDFGVLKKEGDSLTGEVRTTRFGILHSNVSDENLASIGVGDGEWIQITLGENSVKAQYIKDFAPGPDSPAPTSNRFLIHPRAEYNRLILLPAPGVNFEETFPFEKGNTFVIKKTEPEEPAEGEEAGQDQEEEAQGS
jgi:hypothetical protein